MRKNTVKQALADGKLQLGAGFGQLRSPEIPKILAAAGFHWAFLDTEHGGFDLETVQDICRVSVMVGLSPIVRVADMQYSLIARALREYCMSATRTIGDSPTITDTRQISCTVSRSKPPCSVSRNAQWNPAAAKILGISGERS